jgi:hypothetical protein
MIGGNLLERRNLLASLIEFAFRQQDPDDRRMRRQIVRFDFQRLPIGIRCRRGVALGSKQIPLELPGIIQPGLFLSAESSKAKAPGRSPRPAFSRASPSKAGA